MNHTLTLTRDRMRLAMRNRAFLFFSMIMPLAFLFLFLGIFARGNQMAVSFMFGPVLALTVMGSFWGLSIQLVMFREQGILRRFRLAPVSAAELLASSVLSNYILTLPTIVIQFILARWVFHLPSVGNLWGVAVLVTLGTFAFATLGLVVASVTNTMQETQVINNAIWFVFLFLSGATFPLAILPSWVRNFSNFLPATYLVHGLQEVLQNSRRLGAILEEIGALAVLTLFAFFLSVQLFRWEPEAKVTRRAKLWAASTIIPFLLLGGWETRYGHLREQTNTNFQMMQRGPAAPSPQPDDHR